MGYCYTGEALLMVLADGLGGHPLGEVAAQLALYTLARRFQAHAHPVIADPAAFLHDTILLAHQDIHRHAQTQALPEAPRTTVVCCLLQHGCVHWAHAGDSRFYLVRDGRLLTRTRDHSKIESLLQEGRVSSAQAAVHPERNILYNCLGSPHLPQIDVGGPLALETGDIAMLCSDGLWGSLAESTLTGALQALPVSQAIPALIDSALLEAGASADNTTAIAVEWSRDIAP